MTPGVTYTAVLWAMIESSESDDLIQGCIPLEFDDAPLLTEADVATMIRIHFGHNARPMTTGEIIAARGRIVLGTVPKPTTTETPNADPSGNQEERSR